MEKCWKNNEKKVSRMPPGGAEIGEEYVLRQCLGIVSTKLTKAKIWPTDDWFLERLSLLKMSRIGIVSIGMKTQDPVRKINFLPLMKPQQPLLSNGKTVNKIWMKNEIPREAKSYVCYKRNNSKRAIVQLGPQLNTVICF